MPASVQRRRSQARAVADRSAPRVARLAAVLAAQLVLVARLAQPRERRRVAAALGEAVPAEPERVRPPSEPQLLEVRLRRRAATRTRPAAGRAAGPCSARQVGGVERMHQPADRLRCSWSRTWRCSPPCAPPPSARRRGRAGGSRSAAPPHLARRVAAPAVGVGRGGEHRACSTAARTARSSSSRRELGRRRLDLLGPVRRLRAVEPHQDVEVQRAAALVLGHLDVGHAHPSAAAAAR